MLYNTYSIFILNQRRSFKKSLKVKRKDGANPSRSRRCKAEPSSRCHWETGKTRTGEDAEPEELPSLMKTTDPLRMVRCIPEADGAGCFQVSILRDKGGSKMNQKILTASLAALVLTTGAFSVQAESTPPEFLFVK